MTAAERFEAIYRAEAANVLRYARFRVGPDLAEDVVADTFAVAWQKLDRVPDPPRPWLLATARRVSANQIRARRRLLLNQVAFSDVPADDEPRTADESTAIDRRHDLIASLRILPPLDREAVLLVTWHDLSNTEAAGVMEVSVTAFAVRLHRARRRLARIVDDRDRTPHLDPNTKEVGP